MIVQGTLTTVSQWNYRFFGTFLNVVSSFVIVRWSESGSALSDCSFHDKSRVAYFVLKSLSIF